MKVFLSIACLAVVVFAEPPRYRQQQRQYYFARQEDGTTVDAAPYPPSGWKPPGSAFNLPQKQVPGIQQSPQQNNVPQRQYNVPQQKQQQYGAPTGPQQQYGAPEQRYETPNTPTFFQREYGAAEDATTTEIPNSTEEEEISTVQSIPDSESEPVNSVNELDDEDLDKKQPQQTGEYYVALPDGRIQRIRYVSRQDVEAMKYFAKVRAENVEPLRGPIYAYTPLQKLQILPTSLQLSVTPIAAAAPLADAKPQKLEIEPMVAQVQYQYDNPAGVIPLANNPLSNNPYATYQAPTPGDSRFLLTFQ